MAAYKYLSDALPQALANIGWSQKDLADKTGMPPSQISRYCNGGNHPPSETFERLLRALPEDQHGLVTVAYLRDCLPADYRSVVEINPVSNRIKEESPTLIPGTDAELDGLLRRYADLGMRHTSVRDMLRSFLDAIKALPAPAQETGNGT